MHIIENKKFINPRAQNFQFPMSFWQGCEVPQISRDSGLPSPSKGGLRTPDSGTPAHFNYLSLDHVNQP